MHVYAPGDHTYRVIGLRLDTPEFVQQDDTTYPVSTPYHFEPLNETVPVYEGPFSLVQEITIPMTQEIGALSQAGDLLTVEGTLEYQACDHEICYLPAEVPLRWEFEWRAPDQRVRDATTSVASPRPRTSESDRRDYSSSTPWLRTRK